MERWAERHRRVKVPGWFGNEVKMPSLLWGRLRVLLTRDAAGVSPVKHQRDHEEQDRDQTDDCAQGAKLRHCTEGDGYSVLACRYIDEKKSSGLSESPQGPV